MSLHRLYSAGLACLAIAMGTTSASEAPEGPALLRLVAESPSLVAAHRRAQAARARQESAGRVPDPTIEGMASRMVGPMDERATMWELNLRQPLPKKGERGADRDRAAAAGEMAEADYALMAGEMAADAAMALAEAAGARERIRLLQAQITRLEAVLGAVEARLAADSGGRIAERLTVQSRIASMQLMIEEERRMVADAEAGVRGRLGLAPGAQLPDYVAPEPEEVRVEEAAALRLAAARSSEASAMARMARASANPMTSVGLRFERNRTGMGEENTLGVAFMSDLPWRSRGYARAEVRAAEAERSAAIAEAGAARHRAAAALRRVMNARAAAEAARRLTGDTLSRIRAEQASLANAAGAVSPKAPMGGDSTVLMTVELLDKAVETELQLLRADVAVRTTRAELWRHVPAGRFPQPVRE